MMCLAIPARIVALDDGDAVVDVRGNRRTADVSLLDEPKLGDYVLVHAGFAIQRLTHDDAEQRLAICRSLEEAIDQPAD